MTSTGHDCSDAFVSDRAVQLLGPRCNMRLNAPRIVLVVFIISRQEHKWVHSAFVAREHSNAFSCSERQGQTRITVMSDDFAIQKKQTEYKTLSPLDGVQDPKLPRVTWHKV